MNTSYKEQLFAHVPENVQIHWASQEGIVPAGDPWKGTLGPSLEVGRALFNRISARDAEDLIPKVTNPDVLLEVAKTDRRVGVGRALLDSEYFPLEGLKVLLEKSKLWPIESLATTFDYGAMYTHGHDDCLIAVWNSVRQLGYVGAIDQVLDLALKDYEPDQSDRHCGPQRALRHLLDTRNWDLEDGLVSPKEHVDGIIHMLSRADEWSMLDRSIRLGNLFPRLWRIGGGEPVPDPTDVERLVRAVAQVSPEVFKSARIPLNGMLENYEHYGAFSGPVPDLSHLTGEGSTHSQREVAFDIRCAWSQAEPLDVDELRDVWGFEAAKFRTGYMTARAALAMRSGNAVNFWDTPLVDPIEHMLSMLAELESSIGDTSLASRSKELVYDIGSMTSWMRSNKGFVVTTETAEPVEQIVRQILNLVAAAPAGLAFRLVRSGQQIKGLVHPSAYSSECDLQELTEKVYLQYIFDGDEDVDERGELLNRLECGDLNMPAVLNEALSRLRAGQVSDTVWLQLVQYLDSSLQTEIYQDSPGRFAQALRSNPEMGNDCQVTSIVAAVNVCANEADRGNYTYVTDLYDALATTGAELPGDILGYLPDKVHTLGQVAEVSVGLVAQELSRHLGSDPSGWQLAVELLDDWDGDLPSLVDTVTAVYGQ